MNNQAVNIDEIVNLDDYPLNIMNQTEYTQFASACQQAYKQTGLCMLPDFIRPESLDKLSGEANKFAQKAYFCKSSHNAYLTDEDESLPETDVHHRQEETYVGSVAYDLIPQDSHLKQLYLWDPLRDFIKDVLSKDTLYRFADPFGACSINVFVDGGEHGWHFDESEFTVTLMLQSPESGGSFEYLPKIRGLENEQKIVEGVLDGNREGIVELPFTPGTLLIFAGNQTIHRVTRVGGNTPRLVPVLCYSEQRDTQNSESVRKLFWGRKGPEQAINHSI